jgi:sortase (surface protein transpeptidase)
MPVKADTLLATRLHRIRFYVTVVALYGLTLWTGWYAVRPVSALDHTSRLTRAEQHPHTPVIKAVPIISGRPVRIVIPDSGIDLPVDPGYYDAATDSWTLSGYNAQFAMISTLANDHAGETFIYGHNNNYVFGALRHNTPALGAQALIYTDNNRIFSYTFANSTSVDPSDVSYLNYAGPPQLVIQTCTGSFNEWRTMYVFNFDKVVQ